MENEVQDKNRYEVQWVTDRSQFMKGLVWHTKDLEGLPTAVFPKGKMQFPGQRVGNLKSVFQKGRIWSLYKLNQNHGG